MARKLIVEIIGDASKLEKSYRQAERGTKQFGSSIERAGRGAVVASVGFRGLGRAVGFASASFLGGAGLVTAITSTVKAAEESQAVLGQTRNAVQRSGLSWEQYGAQIEAASKATSQLSGFDDEKLLQTFSNLVRRTGDVNQALKLNALAANVARGRNIELEAASGLVLKASIGNVGALRRLGINLDKHATALQAIDLLTRRYSGSAAAYGQTAAGAQDRFRVALQNMQEVLGAELLPAITDYLNKGAKWLNNTENQQRVLKDLKEVIGLVTGVLHGLKSALDTVNTVTGSTKNTVKLLFGALVAFKTLKLASTLTGIAGSLGLVGTNAGSATGKVTGLRGALGKLGAIGIITVEIELILHSKGLGEKVGEKLADLMGKTESDADLAKVPKAKSPFEFFSKGFDITDTMVAGLIQRHKLSLDQIKKLRSRFLNDFQYQLALLQAQGVEATRKAAESAKHLAAVAARGPHDLPTVQAAAPILGRGALTAMQRNALAQSAAARTQGTKDDLAALREQRELLAKAIRTETARLSQATTADAAKSYADNLQSLYDKDSEAFGRIRSLTEKGARQAGKTAAELAGQRNSWFDTAIGRMLDRVQDIPNLQGQIAKLRSIGALIEQQIAAVKDVTRKQTLADQLLDVQRQISADQDQITSNAADRKQAAADRKATAQQALLERLQFNVDKTGLTDTLKDDLKALQTQQATIKQIIATQGSTLALQQQLLGVETNIKSKNQEIADQRKQRAEAAKQAAADAKAAAAAAKQQAAADAQAASDAFYAARQSAQFQALGLLPSGDQPIFLTDLKKQLAQARAAVKGTKLDTKEVRKELAGIQDVLNLKFGVPLYTTGQKVIEMLDELTGKVKGLGAATIGFRHVSSQKFVESLGLNLTVSQKRRLEMGVAQLGRGNTLPQRTAQFAGSGGAAPIVIHSATFHGVTDMRAFEQQLQKRAKGRAHTRRGG